jgi:hypothetical protein
LDWPEQKSANDHENRNGQHHDGKQGEQRLPDERAAGCCPRGAEILGDREKAQWFSRWIAQRQDKGSVGDASQLPGVSLLSHINHVRLRGEVFHQGPMGGMELDEFPAAILFREHFARHTRGKFPERLFRDEERQLELIGRFQAVEDRVEIHAHVERSRVSAGQVDHRHHAENRWAGSCHHQTFARHPVRVHRRHHRPEFAQVIAMLGGRVQTQERDRIWQMKLHLIHPIFRLLDLEHRSAFSQQPFQISLGEEVAHAGQIRDHLRPRHGPILRGAQAGAQDRPHEVELVLLDRASQVAKEAVREKRQGDNHYDDDADQGRRRGPAKNYVHRSIGALTWRSRLSV